MTRAESGADAVHDALRADLGESSAWASGYLSEYFFLRERDLILDVIGDETGTVLHTAGGARLVAVAPGEARTPCAPTERDASATARRVTSPSLALRCIGSEATAPSGPQTTSATGR